MSSPLEDKSVYHSYSRIVFQDSNNKVFTIKPDGTDCVRIINPGYDVEWSPDGYWITFTAWEEKTENDSVWIMRPDGTSAIPVAYHYDANASYPTWSPNSKEIAYVCYEWEKQEHRIWIVNISNGQKRPLTESSSESPQWISANEISFEVQGNYYDIFIASPAGIKKSEFLSSFTKGNFYYRYSHDASKVASVKNSTTVCIIDHDGSNYKEFNFPDLHIVGIQWSPDDRCVIFSVHKSAGESVQELRAISIDGKYKWMVVKKEYSDGGIKSFSWSPFL